MKLENIEVGKTYKNYRELCRALEIEPHGGRKKIYKLKELGRFYVFERNNFSFTIISKIENPEPKLKVYEELDIEDEDWNSKGVYKIQKDNVVYIGSTISSFRARLQQHLSADYPSSQLLHSGGKMTALSIMNDKSKEEIRSEEARYIQKYRNDSKFVTINAKDARKKKKLYKKIMVLEEQLESARTLLKENNIEFR